MGDISDFYIDGQVSGRCYVGKCKTKKVKNTSARASNSGYSPIQDNLNQPPILKHHIKQKEE